MSDIRKYIELLENAEKTPMSEGVKFGNKQKKEILSSSKINVGIEYEFWAHDPDSYLESYPDSHYVLAMVSDGVDNNFFENFVEVTAEVAKNNLGDKHIMGTSQGDPFFITDDLRYIWDKEFYDESDFNESVFEGNYGSSSYHTKDIVDGIDEIYQSLIKYHNNKDKAFDDEDDNQIKLDSDVIGDVKEIRLLQLIDEILEMYKDPPFEEIRNADSSILDYMCNGLGIGDLEDIINGNFIEQYDNSFNLEDVTPEMVIDAMKNNDYLGDFIDDVDSFAESAYDYGYSKIDIPKFSNIPPLEDITYHIYGTQSVGLIDELPPHDRIEREYDGQIEVITRTIPLKKGLLNIKSMFEHIQEHGHHTDEKSGMHVSISSQDWKREFNAEKFFMLMNIDSIHGRLFGSRQHVDNFNDFVRKAVRKGKTLAIVDTIRKSNNFKQMVDEIYSIIDIKKIAQEKYQSINLGTYEDSDGRVELRYIGGENYEYRYEEIEQEILRATYLLELGYSDLYEREYQKYRYIYLDKIIQESWGHGIVFVKQLLDHVENNPDAIDPDDRKTWKFKGYDVNSRLVNILYV